MTNVSAAWQYDLHDAVVDKDLVQVRKLLQKGADINLLGPRRYGYGSALHIAARESHLDIAKLLIDQGAEIDLLDPKDFTPLHNAAWNGNLEMTELLLDAGADIEASTYEGDTPLTLAQNNDQAQVAEFIQAKLQAPTVSETKVKVAPTTVPGVIDVSGTYISEVTGDNQRLPFSKKIKNPEVKLVQNGNDITGSFGESGQEIWGRIEGDTIFFNWQDSAGNVGKGKWIAKSGSNEMAGIWSHTWWGSGKWNLTKIDSEPDKFIDVSGVYISEFTGDTHRLGLKNKPYPETRIVQTGNTIEGSLGTSCKIYGDIEGNTISFEWGRCRSEGYGRGKWTIQPGGNEIVGKWFTTGGHEGTGDWNLTKIE
jgi:hypothetical protein